MKSQLVVGLKLWSTRTATTPHTDLANKREKKCFQKRHTRFVCNNDV